MDTDALLAVCRTTYRRVMAESGGNPPAAKDAVRFELRRAGFEVAADDQERTAGMTTVIVMLADGHYVQDSSTARVTRDAGRRGRPDSGGLGGGLVNELVTTSYSSLLAADQRSEFLPQATANHLFGDFKYASHAVEKVR